MNKVILFLEYVMNNGNLDESLINELKDHMYCTNSPNSYRFTFEDTKAKIKDNKYIVKNININMINRINHDYLTINRIDFMEINSSLDNMETVKISAHIMGGMPVDNIDEVLNLEFYDRYNKKFIKLKDISNDMYGGQSHM